MLICVGAAESTSSLRIALVESRDLAASFEWKLPDTQFSNRASSITPKSKRFLDTIGAWGKLDLTRVSPYYGMQVWDGVSGSRIEFDWQDEAGSVQDPVIAYMTENDNLVRGLLSRLAEVGGTDIIHGTNVDNISLGPQKQLDSGLDLSTWPHLRLSNGQQIAARLLIGADGPSSPVRSFADIGHLGWDYNRHGLVATLQLSEEPEAKIAYQRFLPTGPAALLPLSGPYATLVWSTTPENAAKLKRLSQDDFVSMVNAAFRLMPVDLAYMHGMPSGQQQELDWRIQHTASAGQPYQIPPLIQNVQAGSIASFPLRYGHANTYATHRIALLGDAAHTIHPLAGQGLNMGLGDVESLSNIIQDAVGHGQDIGDQLTLERYNAERYEHNHRLLGVVDKLHKLYSFESGPIVSLRSLGLDAVNALTPLKSFLMRQAAGT